MALPSASELGTIRSLDGWSYRITPEDLLWLARSTAYEGGDVASTIWTYAQRAASRHVSDFAGMVRSHSQPVNPDWASLTAPGCARSPERCRPALRADGTYGRDPLEVRAEARSRTWDSLPTRDKVFAWAQARLPNTAVRATDFADPTVSAGFLRRNPLARIVKVAGNWYLSEGADSSPRPSNAWPANQVSIEYQGRVATAAAGIGLLGFAALAAGAYAFSRWMR